ncbi:MAG: TatD family hydrolase [Alphaproteobacteria bacterium]|nr:TatD family hydrolase [Alphaproteobacteria bacterium]MCB9690645.1 TatD family hydrolase [Alphaproteobacteria bacterium]
MGLFDIHAHLTDARLAAMEDEVLARAEAAGVTTIVSNGLHPEDNRAVLDLAARSPLVKAAIGLYPVDAVLPEMEAMGVEYPRTSAHTPDEGIAWVRDHVEEAVAVGEIGLDRYWVPQELWGIQEERFRALVRIAMEADKPIIVHSRKAEARMLEVLQELGATRVCWHCFSSKVKLGMRIAEAGHWLSIPANVRRSESFRTLLARLPREKVLLETDCPYLGPDRDALNEPANVAGTAAFAAELWGTTVDAVGVQLSESFEALMGFAP